METFVKKVYPKPEELSTVNNNVKCTEEGCSHIFSSMSNLTLHLVKAHKKVELWEDRCTKEFHCPELSCIYHGAKFFKTFKLVKQHYLKVHSSRNCKCTLCPQSFSTEASLKSHIQYCGVVFKCCECEEEYMCYETLRTHSRRKKHKILQKFNYKCAETVKDSKLQNSVATLSTKKELAILPKPTINLQFILPVTESKISKNQSIQTECEKPKLKSKMTQVSNDIKTEKQKEVYTGTKRRVFLSAETQTIMDYLVPMKKHCIADDYNISADRISITTQTQTDTIPSKTSSCNTSFNLNDFDFIINEDVKKNSSSTQTSANESTLIYSSSTTTHDSIHTDTSDLLTQSFNEGLDHLDSTFYNCHNETQKDFMLQNELFGCDYYSNMYTQTCNDIFIGFGFNDIQTQTAYEDMLRSVESQTVMSHLNLNADLCRGMMHMETQTDMEFKQMLEEINS